VGFYLIDNIFYRFNKVLEFTAGGGSPSNYEEEMKSYYWPNKMNADMQQTRYSGSVGRAT
jgi:hypothetical protein